jgi:hypothetical protein
MAGIDNLVKGAVGTFTKDKVSPYLSPTQQDFLAFALNPQGYLIGKGVTAAADALGYGSQYRELKGGAQDDKEYYKEVMRDTIGDALPESIGDFVRATPRVEEPYDPYNGYFAQNINDWVGTRESTPEVYDRFENTVRDMNYGTQTPGTGKYVGPLAEDNSIFEANVSNLPYELKSTPVSGAPEGFDPKLLAAVIRDANTTGTGATDDLGEVTVVDQKTPSGGGDLSYTEMIDVLNSTLNSTPNTGINVPATESFAPMDFGGTMDYSDFGGGGGGKGNIEDYSYSQYKRGGQVCGCKH